MKLINKITTIDDLNLSKSLIHEQIIKTIFVNGSLKGMALSNILKVPFAVLEEEILSLKKRELVVIVGASGAVSGYHTMDYDLTLKGREFAREVMLVRSYIGPLPVSIDEYRRVMSLQTVNSRAVTSKVVDSIFEDMVLPENYFSKIGPAINSGGPILFYGEPGNGKTMIAEKIIEAFGDYIYIPYCLLIDGQFIKYFDDKVHHPVDEKINDARWIKIRRPFIVVGGELTLATLDLIYKDEFKYYEAPPQLKANGGILLIDDFGRQLVSPKELLNRWIYPLEKKVDFLTLVTGKKLELPFLQMIVFSSNLKPGDLGDDAFLRRIKYKVEVSGPSEVEFRKIFKSQCEKLGLKYSEEGFRYLLTKYFKEAKRDLRGCHPRDILTHVVDYNTFYSKVPQLSKENIDFACSTYFSFQNK